MRKYVYPDARTRILKPYQQYFEQNISAVHLYLLKSITDQTQRPGYFRGEYLNAKEIDIIKQLFSKINPTLSHLPDYLIMKAAVEELDNIESEINFTDYILSAIDGAEIQLSKLVQRNTLTVLSFWHTLCGPCRAFHQEIRERYPALKAGGVEFVSLNTDESKSLWKKSSDEDVISWPNLYIGRKSEVLVRYRIRGFPAKRVFDKNLRFVDLDATDRRSWWKDLSKKVTT